MVHTLSLIEDLMHQKATIFVSPSLKEEMWSAKDFCRPFHFFRKTTIALSPLSHKPFPSPFRPTYNLPLPNTHPCPPFSSPPPPSPMSDPHDNPLPHPGDDHDDHDDPTPFEPPHDLLGQRSDLSDLSDPSCDPCDALLTCPPTHTAPIHSLAVHAARPRLLATGAEDDSVVLWDLAAEPGVSTTVLRAHTDTVLALGFQPAPGGGTAAGLGGDGRGAGAVGGRPRGEGGRGGGGGGGGGENRSPGDRTTV